MGYADRSKAKHQLVDSGHADGTSSYHQMLENEGQVGGTSHHPSQDLHAMLDVILASYVKLQKTGGVKWDLLYKEKLYEGVEFVFFVPFISHFRPSDSDRTFNANSQ